MKSEGKPKRTLAEHAAEAVADGDRKHVATLERAVRKAWKNAREEAAPLVSALRVAQSALDEAESELRDLWHDHPVMIRQRAAQEQVRRALTQHDAAAGAARGGGA